MMLPPWHPHYDVWAVVFVLGYGYWFANRRLRRLTAPEAAGPTPGQWASWYVGVAALWLVSDWPIHDIGETALFTFHMVEHMVIALVVPPLLLKGLPLWLGDALLGHPRVVWWLRPLARPVPAFALFNATFVTIHWPELVGWMVSGGGVVHFAVHAWLAAVSVLMWMPVFSPSSVIPRLRPPLQMLYLFLQSLLPTVPASFLTFSTVPVYPVYGEAALAYGLSAVADQTIAGIVMKIGGGLLLWSTIAVIWFRWASRERDWERLEGPLRVY